MDGVSVWFHFFVSEIRVKNKINNVVSVRNIHYGGFDGRKRGTAAFGFVSLIRMECSPRGLTANSEASDAPAESPQGSRRMGGRTDGRCRNGEGDVEASLSQGFRRTDSGLDDERHDTVDRFRPPLSRASNSVWLGNLLRFPAATKRRLGRTYSRI